VVTIALCLPLLQAGGGVGVFKDPSAAGGFKAFGHLQLNLSEYVSGWGTEVTAESDDGLKWAVKQTMDLPAPARHDCHNNIFWDGTRYVATTRDVHPSSCDARWSSGCQREIGMTASLPGQGFVFDGATAATMVEMGQASHQLYAQVTWVWHSIYLGIVMVYDATDPVNRVHCRLVWAHPAEALAPATAGTSGSGGWHWVDPAGITGRDFIPLNSTVSAAGENAFDSHLCYAAPPVHTPQGERVYYMGSNGPHSGSMPHRNASLGLAYLRTDGFAGVAGSGTWSTVPLGVAGMTLTLTLDVLGAPAAGSASSAGGGGSVAVGVYAGGQAVSGMSLADCVAISRNSTNSPVRFKDGGNFQHMLGQNVTLRMQITTAIVYTIGWTN
jgi:hypothetical protein